MTMRKKYIFRAGNTNLEVIRSIRIKSRPTTSQRYQNQFEMLRTESLNEYAEFTLDDASYTIYKWYACTPK